MIYAIIPIKKDERRSSNGEICNLQEKYRLRFSFKGRQRGDDRDLGDLYEKGRMRGLNRERDPVRRGGGD